MNINSNLFYIKKYKYRLSFIAIFSIIILGLYIYAYTLAQKNRNGYCFKQQRYVSKQEIIDKMIAYSLTKDFYTDIDIPSYKVGDKWYPLPRIPTENDPLMQNSIESLNRPYGIEHNFPKYSHKENIKNFGYTKQNVSVKEFKQQNPNCCVLDEQARFAERFINKDEKNAGINYFFKIKIPMTYNETANKKQTVLYLYETPVTNCGEDATISQNIITYDDDWFPDPYLSIFDYVKFLKQDSRH